MLILLKIILASIIGKSSQSTLVDHTNRQHYTLVSYILVNNSLVHFVLFQMLLFTILLPSGPT